MDAFLKFEDNTKKAITAILADLESTKRALIGSKRSHDELAKSALATKQSDLYLGPPKKKPVEKTYSAVLAKPFDEDERKFTVLGTILRPEKMPGFRPIIKEGISSYTEAEWMRMANFLRFTAFDSFTSIYPDKREKETDEVKALALDGAEPATVYKLFCFGLLKAVYPGEDLQELSHFPDNFRRAISNFIIRTKCKTRLCLLIHGVAPFFEDGNYLHPRQLIKIGNIRDVPTITKGAPLTQPADIWKYRDGGILNLFDEAQKVKKNLKLKINYQTQNLIILSSFKKDRKKSEDAQLEAWIKSLDGYYLIDIKAPEDDPVPMDQDSKAGPSKAQMENVRENTQVADKQVAVPTTTASIIGNNN